MDDIIWVTYKGRHIPIKPGMKGKFDKKILEKKKVKKEKEGKETKENNKKSYIHEEYGDLSNKENYIKAQNDLVLKKGMSIEESEDILDKYTNIYAKTPKGKETKDKIAKLQEKIDNLRKNDEKYIKNKNDDVKVTGLNTDYDNKEINNLYEEKQALQYELDTVGKRGKATLSDYYNYFLSMGYSKKTALEYAKEQMLKRINE